MNPRTFRYLVAEGIRGISRHRALTVTAVITMTASLLVLGAFLITSYNVREVLADLEGRKEVMVFLTEATTAEDRRLFEERLAMHPAVAGQQFVSAETAWSEFTDQMGVADLEDVVGGNPLPDAYHIVLKPESRDAATITGLAEEVRHWDEVDEVITGGEWVSRLDNFARSILIFTLAVGIAVALSIVVIVASTVRLTVVARYDLIDIMKSVGASEGFIRLPFLSEGVLQALIAATVALALLLGGTFFLERHIQGLVFLSPLWCAGFIGLSLFLGFTGSALSVRHVLRQVGL